MEKDSFSKEELLLEKHLLTQVYPQESQECTFCYQTPKTEG